LDSASRAGDRSAISKEHLCCAATESRVPPKRARHLLSAHHCVDSGGEEAGAVEPANESDRVLLRVPPGAVDVSAAPDASALSRQARPLPHFRHTHTPIRLPLHRDFVQPRSRIQTGAKSVAAPLVCTDAPNIEVLTDFQSPKALGNLGILARLLNSRTEIGVL
jgi:hypothetical protein